LVDEYLAELRRHADRLPRHQRDELVGELRAHLDAGAEQARSEADIRNMLDALGTPGDIVAAAAPPADAAGPSGALALALAVVALVITPVPLIDVVAIPLGVAAVVLGIRTRRSPHAVGRAAQVATAASVIGGIAVVLVVLIYMFLVAV
jgi:hypothetical protein